jgi:hypothetical protein
VDEERPERDNQTSILCNAPVLTELVNSRIVSCSSMTGLGKFTVIQAQPPR